MIPFEIVLTVVSALAGAIASVAGFGIGSILTPLLGWKIGTQLAVAAISIPHFAATLARFWMLRAEADRKVVMRFGVLSAAGGRCGALLHGMLSNPALTYLFAMLLLFAGVMALTGLSQRMRFGRKTAWLAGALSGLLGGLVGNQGGIRSAALLGFGLERHAFVGTATAIGLIVDLARMPVYFATSHTQLGTMAGLIALSTVGVPAGTFAGRKVLRRIEERTFRISLGLLLLALGTVMWLRAEVR